ncbi:O-antigen ligase family protein [Actimicrobium antarcticum]|uniref:O-antigen ligase family protein n=1 Tax=Actimicrobium antarcticum TaxID=1051899 RepID=UPI0031D38F6B
MIAFNWLLFLYPASLAVNKTLHDVVSVSLLLLSLICLVRCRAILAERLQPVRKLWILALVLPICLAAAQYFLLDPPLPLRGFDDVSRYLPGIPIYLALLVTRPNFRYFLRGCLVFVLYSVALLLVHMQILGLDRGAPPNGFLAIIPQTSLTIVLAALSTWLWLDADGTWRKRIPPILLCLLGLAAPLLSVTRSGLLIAASLGIVAWLLLARRNLLVPLCGAAVAVITAVVVMSSSTLWPRQDNTVTEINQYLTRPETALTSATIRIELWRAAGKMFLSHPVLGIGNHRFPGELGTLVARKETRTSMELFTHPHNEFLRAAAEGGIVGILSLALLYGVPMAAGIAAYSSPARRIGAGVLIVLTSGFILAGLVDILLYWRETILFFSITMSLMLVALDTGWRTDNRVVIASTTDSDARESARKKT